MLVLTAVYHTIDLTMCVSLPRKFRHSVTRLGINHISCLICSIWSLVGGLNCCLLPIMPHTCPDWRIWSPWQDSNIEDTQMRAICGRALFCYNRRKGDALNTSDDRRLYYFLYIPISIQSTLNKHKKRSILVADGSSNNNAYGSSNMSLYRSSNSSNNLASIMHSQSEPEFVKNTTVFHS